MQPLDRLPSKKGLGLMLLSALIFGLSDAFMKSLSASFPATQIGFIRFALGGLILWPILRSKKIPLKGQCTWILLLRGLGGTLSFFCLVKSFALIPLSTAIVLFYTFPVFVALFSALLFRVTIGRGELLLIGAGMTGIYILADPEVQPIHLGYLLGILGSSLAGLATVMVHKARQQNGPFIIYFYFCLMGTLISFPFFGGFRWPDTQQGLLFMALAVIALVAQVLMNQGFKYCQATEGSLILMSEAIFASLAGILMFKEPITLRFLAGAMFIIGSGLGLNLVSRRSRHAPVS